MKKAFALLGALTVIGLALASLRPADAGGCDSNTVQGNCVLYAHSQVRSLPTGLTYYQAKLDIRPLAKVG